MGAPLTTASSPRSSSDTRPGKCSTPIHHSTNMPAARNENRYSPPGQAFARGFGIHEAFATGVVSLPVIEAPQAAGSARPKAPRSFTRHWVIHAGRMP